MFLNAACPSVLNYILEDIEDELSTLTMKEAMRYAAKYPNNMINLALKIRCASFCSQRWGSIVGTETLGIRNLDFNEFGKCGYAAYDRGVDRPLPLSIDHQIDVALLLTAQEYQKGVVKELQRKIFQEGEKPWYEIYLTTYILLANLEYVNGGSSDDPRTEPSSSHWACYFQHEQRGVENVFSGEYKVQPTSTLTVGLLVGLRNTISNIQECIYSVPILISKDVSVSNLEDVGWTAIPIEGIISTER
jgi:hypothetical protein